MQITEICNPSAYRHAVGSAYIRQQVYVKDVGSVPAATMAGYQDLNFNAGALRNVSVRTVERTIIDMGFRNRCPTRLPLLIVWHTALRLAWAGYAAIELLMTGIKLSGLMSLISNCIG
ncbi:hypothetical protein AVEN_105719-1 [Araneus ventricosus]|uniref:Uncharacterized protein n=1 Tax=Araneus ventricosus TaxID=182803 RepID=A0A4Y2SXK5_ARAVE|nr:hypothetical protein AVEN_105719-1 [Araneus ventricosus]